MYCKEKSTLKLSSNIITKKMGENHLECYLPIELKPKYNRDIRLRPYLSEQQRLQLDKELFYAKKVYDDKEPYPEKKENIENCKNCQYKDICF